MDLLISFLSSLPLIDWLLIVVAVIIAIYAIARFLDDKFEGGAIAIGALICAAIGVIGAGHFVVGPNERAIMIYSNGAVDATTFSSGIHTRPLLGYIINTYPGQSDYQWCPEFTPGVSGGIEVKATFCMRLDLSKVDWKSQFLRWGQNAEGLFETWRRELAPLVAAEFSKVSPLEIRENRLGVTESVGAALSDWFTSEGIPASRYSLTNWDFTSDEVRKQYDTQVTSTIKQEAVQAEQKSAELERNLELYRAETYRQVLSSRTSAEQEALHNLNLPEDVLAYYLIQSRLVSFLENNSNVSVVVTVGGNDAPYVKSVP